MKNLLFILTIVSLFILNSCTDRPSFDINYNPKDLKFSGEKALNDVGYFATTFTNRHSGTKNNLKAAHWLQSQFDSIGLETNTTEWDIINYSEEVTLRNVIARLPGKSEREILIVAHYDQFSGTIQGADNDASGIAILLQLASIFANEAQLPYSITFLASDGEEYGMLGTKHYIDNHPNTAKVIAGISLDNLGKEFYSGLRMDARGQFNNYGKLWLQLLTTDVAEKSDSLWVPKISPPLFQVLFQAVPVSFMDEGPIVSANIPAFGLAGAVAAGKADKHWDTYHTPYDLVEYQSATSLYHAGSVTEGVIRQLMMMDNFPTENGPYIYSAQKGKVFKGFGLWIIFILVVLGFGLISLMNFKKIKVEKQVWINSFFHFLSLWLPMIFSIFIMYLLVAVGLMDTYDLYPGCNKDPVLTTPLWPAIAIWTGTLIVMIWGARKLALKYFAIDTNLVFLQLKPIAFLIIFLSGIFFLIINPFSLLFLLPLYFWAGINKSKKMWINIVYLLAGGLLIYVLIYFFGFVILRINLNGLWYIMMMFSIKMIPLKTAMVITALLSAGISLVVKTKLSSKLKS